MAHRLRRALHRTAPLPSGVDPSGGQDRTGEEDGDLGPRLVLPKAPRGVAGVPGSQADRMVQYAIGIANGRPYAADAGRFGYDHFDCSGLVSRVVYDFGFPHDFTPISGPMARYCREHGGNVPLEVAFREAGHILFMGGESGTGPAGHVCFSAGLINGVPYTMEARGTRYGCGMWLASGRTWSGAARWPGVNYGPSAPPAPPTPQYEHDDEEDDVSDTLTRWTANNLPGEWHVGHIAGGNLWHRWGPRNDSNRELLCGPSGAKFGKPVTAPLVAVTAQRGVANDGGRLDLYAEDEDGNVAHLWRSRDSQPWSFELVP